MDPPLAAAFAGDAAATSPRSFSTATFWWRPCCARTRASRRTSAGTRVATAAHVKQTTVVGLDVVNGTAADEVPVWAPPVRWCRSRLCCSTPARSGRPAGDPGLRRADGAALVEDDGETTAYAGGKGVRRTSLADDGAATLTWTCKGAAAAGAFTQLKGNARPRGGAERKSAVVEIGDGGGGGAAVSNASEPRDRARKRDRVRRAPAI